MFPTRPECGIQNRIVRYLYAHPNIIEKFSPDDWRELANPWYEQILPAEFLTSDVLALTKRVRETQDYTILPILADALQDANCDVNEVLEHFRSDTKHHAGCWALATIPEKL